MLREISEELSKPSKVCIVDTENEIGGHGDVAHSSIGHARRLMVPGSSIESAKQSETIVEAIVNYKPHVLVVDELRVSSDTQAALCCKNSGVRLIASARGDLNQLLQSTHLRGLIMDDHDHNGELSSKKPIFDCVVELSSDHDTFQVVWDPLAAAKQLQCGGTFPRETRVRVKTAASVEA